MGLGGKSITTPNSPRQSERNSVGKHGKNSEKSNAESYGDYNGLDEMRLDNVNIALKADKNS